MNKIITPILMSIAAIIGAIIGYYSKPTAQSIIAYDNELDSTAGNKYGKLQQIIDVINTYYVDSVDLDSITETLIQPILDNLDPHTVYIPIEEIRHVNDDLRSDFGGIGVTFVLKDDTVNVISVISGGPSSRLGVLPGDKIIKVNGHDFVGDYLDNNMVMDSLRGQIGTQVQITVKRKKDNIDFDITRETIPMYSVVASYMIDGTVGYMKIDRFAEKTYEEMMTNLAKLKKGGCQTIIVDLRSNSGGYLDAVIKMCNEFLQADDLIVYTEGLHQTRTDVKANGKGNFQDMNVVVLIDEFSASASEIFAGAMQDNDRGVVVGRRSYGKGLVQSQMELVDGSAMRVTVARYHTPSGRCIQRPYENGSNEDYYNDAYARYLSSEAICADSIKYDKNQAYQTKNGRKVYGGGGIIPDFFVPTDTSKASYYFVMLRTKGLFHTFAVDYANRHRDELSALSVDELIEYLEKENILPELIKYATKNGIKAAPITNRERPFMDSELKANIARNIDEEAYYPIINKLDKAIDKAVEIAQPAEE